jgi:hypothetical protein
VQFKLAILSLLANRPDGRATLDELRGEIAGLTINEHEPDELDAALDEIDIFQSGLVTPEDGGLRITDTGRAALNTLIGSVSPSQPLKSIDDLVGTEDRLKIFDLDLRKPGEGIDFTPVGEKVETTGSEDIDHVSAGVVPSNVSVAKISIMFPRGSSRPTSPVNIRRQLPRSLLPLKRTRLCFLKSRMEPLGSVKQFRLFPDKMPPTSWCEVSVQVSTPATEGLPNAKAFLVLSAHD